MNINYDTGIEFPPDIHDWLVERFYFGYAAHVAMKKQKILQTFDAMGISASSELAHLYLNYGPFCVGGHYSLNEIEEFEEWTAYARDELGVPDGYVAMTSIEGQGITLYCRESGCIYDVGFGQFEDLGKGDLEPSEATVVDFLRRCKEHDVEELGTIEEIKPLN